MTDWLRREWNGARAAILGVGSVLRGDDGAGAYLMELLEGRLGDTLLVRGDAAPENFTGVIKAYRPELLFAVDAAWMDLPPGTARPLAPEQAGGLGFSTHMLPLELTLGYLVRETGCRVRLIGIQPERTDAFSGLSEAVRRGTEALAAAFVAAYQGTSRPPTSTR